MTRRPWPLILLAIGQLLSPVMNTFLNAWLENVSPWEYFRTFIEYRSFWAIVDYLVLDPLSGVAIWSMKLWVYPLFVVLQVWIFGNNAYQWFTQFRDSPQSLVVLAVCLVNMGVVTYYLLPQVRVFFFNRRMRWWEAAPRYFLGIDASLETPNNCAFCTIHDISTGGVFVEKAPDLTGDCEITVKFVFLGIWLSFKGRVVHAGKRGSGSYGIQFTQYEDESFLYLNRLLKGLKIMGRAANRNPEPAWGSFKKWILRLVKTGKGLIPEVSTKTTTQTTVQASAENRNNR